MDSRLAPILENCKKAVFFGGAGVSTESGIPDFRSEDGVFAALKKYGRPPEELLSRSFFMRSPEVFYDYYIKGLIHTEAQPNAAHLALAKMERDGRLAAVVTQNIDGLHQLAGSENVFELHGSVRRNYCMQCGRKYNLDYILEPGNAEDGIPKCAHCGGIVRTDVVLYEEILDDTVVAGAVGAISNADVLIVGGTALVVYPAAGLLRYFNGDSLVLINKTPTPYDIEAQLVIHDSIGKVLSEVVIPISN